MVNSGHLQSRWPSYARGLTSDAGTHDCVIITSDPVPIAYDCAHAQVPAGGDRTGFQPGEEVALVYVLTRQTANADGVAPLHLPAALLASRREGLVMVGLTSHVIANIQ